MPPIIPAEVRIADLAARRSFNFLERFGLPTLFAVLLFILCGFEAWLYYRLALETAVSNQIKIDRLNTIIANQGDMKGALAHLSDMLGNALEVERAWQQDHRNLEQRQEDILRRLDQTTPRQRGQMEKNTDEASRN